MPPLPDLTGNQPPAIVADSAALGALCAELANADLIALDTEFMRTDTYTPRLCLIQIATGNRIWCIDELADIDTGPLWQQLASGNGLQILHAAKQDLEVVYVTHGVLPGPLFDTQIAAGLLGYTPQIGYGNLVRELLGIELEKAHTRADWSQRPLAPALLHYAAEDVQYLPELHERLRDRLREHGRESWAEEDCQRLLDPALYRANPAEAWQRIGGLQKLPEEARLRAYRLAQWREEQAVARNRPRQWIMADRLLMELAQSNPPDRKALAEVPEMPGGLMRRQGDRLLELLAGTPASDDPAATPPAAPEPVDKQLYRRLADVVTARAGELGIAAELLATRRDMNALIRGEPGVRVLEGWRREVIGERLLATLES